MAAAQTMPPRDMMRIRPIFWAIGSLSLKRSGMGVIQIRRSMAMLRPDVWLR